MIDRVVVKGQAERETEKAVLIEIEFSLCDGEPRGRSIWLPKSQITAVNGGFEVPTWLVQKKLEEISERCHHLQVMASFDAADGDGYGFFVAN